MDDDIHSVPPPPREDDNSEIILIFGLVFVVVFFVVLVVGLLFQLLARAVLKHNENTWLTTNMEQYFSRQHSEPRNSRTKLIRSISQTYPVKDDDTLQFIQYCHCHGERINV